MSPLCFFITASHAQIPSWQWAKFEGLSSTNNDASIALDMSGNIYLVQDNIFLEKCDSNGDLLWLKSASGKSKSVAVDFSGNIHIVGNYIGQSIILDSITLPNITPGYNDIFLAKIDANGNILWAKSSGGTTDDYATSISVDASGNTYVAGYFKSSSISFGSITLLNTDNSGNYYDGFLVKYDVSGNELWAKRIGGIYSDYALAIAVDASGNPILTGMYDSPAISIGATTLTNAGSNDIFLAKYDTNGNELWAKTVGGYDNDEAYCISVDSFGNAFIAGFFYSNTINFGSTTLTNSGNSSIFLAKYDISGNVLWAKNAIGTAEDYAKSVAVNASGNIFLTGTFDSNTIRFGSITLTNAYAGHFDIFFTKFDSNGNVLWAKSSGGTSNDFATSVSVDASGNTYVAGIFDSPTLNIDTITLTNMGPWNIFIAKLSNNSGINELSNTLNISVFPNPSIDIIKLIIPEKATIEILNINGQTIKTILSNSESTSIDIVDLYSGVYIVRVKTDKEIATKKFIKE
jgi:hypothetical protein